MSATEALPFPIEGDLSAIKPVELVRLMFENRLSGSLIFQQGERKKALYVKNGRPAGAKSNDPGESLLRLAKRFGQIDDDTFNSVVKLLNENATQSQEAAMAAAGVPAPKLDALQKRQTAIRFADVCMWSAGNYRFKPELPDAIPGEPVDPIAVFSEYLKLKFKPDDIRKLAADFAQQSPTIDDSRFNIYKGYVGPKSDIAEAIVKAKGANGNTAIDVFGDSAMPASLRLWLAVCTLLELQVVKFVPATPKPITSQPANPPAKTAELKPPPESTQSAPESAALVEKYKQMCQQNYFEILGIADTADSRTIKKTYFALAKQYHPDKYFDAVSKQANKPAEQVFSLINQAYEELRIDEKRQAYRDFIEHGTTADAEMQKAEDILKSEVEFQKATVLVRLRKYREAIEHLKIAIDLHTDEPEYNVLLYWAQFMTHYPNDKNVYESSLINLKKLLDQGGRAATADAWYFLGRMQKITNNIPAATQTFKKVISIDKKHKDAARELRALESKTET